MRYTDLIRRTLAEHPDQPTTPVEALLHTLAVCNSRTDDEMAITATSGIYGDGIRTGLTWGDLRALAALLDAERAQEPRECRTCGEPVDADGRIERRPGTPCTTDSSPA